ncbi:MAG: PAS domain-containing protein [Bacteroidetes bacterium]|jgi:PAS domain S-box-containing protein|nr:PAS domain-containing protein [Bacteroidota bacterium]
MRPGAKFLHSLFEVTHVEFQTYDIFNHKLLFSSGVVQQLLGYTPEEYQSLSDDFYKNILYPGDLKTVQDTIDKLLHAKDGQVVEMTVRLLKHNGDYIWVYSRQMIYEKDPVNHICSIIREVEDVTQLIELQDELKAKVDQLKVVSYKNSHLLRSPVASIIGLVDMVEEHGITSEHNRQILSYLKDAIMKLDEVIHQINDAARVD